MATLGELVVAIRADASKFVSGIKESTKQLEGFSARAKKSAESMQTFGIGIVAVGTAITGALGLAVREAGESQRVLAQLDTVLKSTQHAAGLTKNEITGLAAEMQKLTAFSDEEVIASSNLLLTFTKVSKEVFPQAQKAILDVSVAFGKDLQGATITVGKALQDPEKGLTALSRVGIQFSQVQKDMIKDMLAAGDTAGAQAIILKELETQVGGSAAAFRNTLPGAIQATKNSMGELMESVGGVLIPIFNRLADTISKLAARFQEWFNSLSDGEKRIAVFTTAISGLSLIGIGGLILALPKLIDLFNGFKKALIGVRTAMTFLLTNPLGLALTAMGAAIFLVITHWHELKTEIQDVFGFFKATVDRIQFEVKRFLGFFNIAPEFFKAGLSLLEALWAGIKFPFVKIFAGIKAFVGGIIKLFSGGFKEGAAVKMPEAEKAGDESEKALAGLKAQQEKQRAEIEASKEKDAEKLAIKEAKESEKLKIKEEKLRAKEQEKLGKDIQREIIRNAKEAEKEEKNTLKLQAQEKRKHEKEILALQREEARKRKEEVKLSSQTAVDSIKDTLKSVTEVFSPVAFAPVRQTISQIISAFSQTIPTTLEEASARVTQLFETLNAPAPTFRGGAGAGTLNPILAATGRAPTFNITMNSPLMLDSDTDAVKFKRALERADVLESKRKF